MMYYYYVNQIGDGSRENPFRPNIPEGTNFVGMVTVDDMFLVATNDGIPNYNELADIQSFCQSHHVNYSDVLKWFVGDNS